MALLGAFRRVSTAVVAVSLLASSAAAAAPRTVDPLLALSVLGTSESRAAVCAAAAAQAAAAAGAAVAAQGTAPTGCVLPVMDAAPPPAVAEAGPPPAIVAAPAVGSSGIALPLLLGLAAIVGLAAVVLKHADSDGEINLPVSP